MIKTIQKYEDKTTLTKSGLLKENPAIAIRHVMYKETEDAAWSAHNRMNGGTRHLSRGVYVASLRQQELQGDRRTASGLAQDRGLSHPTGVETATHPPQRLLTAPNLVNR